MTTCDGFCPNLVKKIECQESSRFNDKSITISYHKNDCKNGTNIYNYNV